MAVDKLVDSTQLDADLTSVANAIRTKGGTSAQLAFPAGFVSAIDAIPTGGGGVDYLRMKIFNQTVENYTIADGEGKHIGVRAFDGWSGLKNVMLLNVGKINTYAFNSCSGLITATFKTTASDGFNAAASVMNGCSNLEVVDLAGGSSIGALWFSGCSKLGVLVLRKTSIYALNNVNVLSSTKFKSGGAGGTIYIPKALYDHLGDGTANDYKAATNWSTIDGYGTITWAKIEGSIYETKYADGTTIPTT